tara:strand:+ start:19249 stop:19500 length:252 start_codon:yes stop_codon:yes gene_type:complete
MITLVTIGHLKYNPRFGEDTEKMIDDLRQKYIDIYGKESYARSAIIVVAEANFFHIIKNIYNLPNTYEFTDNLQDFLLENLDL